MQVADAEPYIFPTRLRPSWEEIDPNSPRPVDSGLWVFDHVAQQPETLRYRVWYTVQRNIPRESAPRGIPFTIFGTLNIAAQRLYGDTSVLKAIRQAVLRNLRDTYPSAEYHEPVIRYIRRLNPDVETVLIWLGALYEREALKTGDAYKAMAETISVNEGFTRINAAHEHMVIIEKAIGALMARFPTLPVGMIVIRGQNLIRRARGLEALHV